MQASPPVISNLRVPQVAANLDGILDGFRSYQVLKAALDLGLFELLDKEPGLGREELAKRLKINGTFIRSFLMSLSETGLVLAEGDAYRNTETAEHFLVPSSPLFQGDWIEADTGKGSRWSNLTQELQKEKPESYAFDAAPRVDFIRALGQRSLRGELQAAARTASAWEGFDRAGMVLDLGGGHGLYAIALCQLNPGLRGVVFDKPHVVPEARSFIEAYGMGDRLQAVGGDIDADDIGEMYDIVVASHVLYKFRKDMPGFFRKVRRALKPGGLFVSNHWFCAPGCVATAGVSEMDKAFFSFGHPLCHIEKFDQMLGECGFNVLTSLEIGTPGSTSTLHLLAESAEARVGERPVAAACCSAR